MACPVPVCVAVQPLGGLPASALSKLIISIGAAAMSKTAASSVDAFTEHSNLMI
jgi:hypothetical protein